MKNSIVLFRFKVFLFLFFLNIIFIFLFFFLNNDGKTDVVFLDVGQGSGTFIKTKSGKNILIDSGFEQKGLKSLAREMNFFDKNIDVIFLTHYDRDHGGQIPFLMKNFKVDLFLDSGIEKIEGSQKNLFEEIKRVYKLQNIKKESLSAGDWIFLEEDIKIKILYPFSDLKIEDIDANYRSVVMQIFINDFKILITGDLSKKYENILVDFFGESLKSDILVASHHGSKTSSSEKFLEAVSPKYFIVQAGKNSYGHPHKEVLDRADFFNLKILENLKMGNIKFSIGEEIILKN